MGAFEEKMRVLIDTCVMIDGLNDREPFAEVAQTILLAVERGYVTGCVSAKSLTDIYYLSRKEMHDIMKTNAVVKWVLDKVQVLDTTIEDCRRGFDAERVDFEDSVAIETAVRERMNAIVTRNVKDFEDSPIPVYTPQGFVEKFLRGGEMGEALS